VLFPATSDERKGVEDAGFVRFVDDDGSTTYHATYTLRSTGSTSASSC
jgi:hypothetical protein